MTKSSGKTPTKRRPRRARPVPKTPSRPQRRAHRTRPSTIIGVAVAVVLGIVVLYLIYQSSQRTPAATGTTTGGSGFNHVAGEPGIGATAPDFTLAAHTGGSVSLADYRGESVLLYFQEGLMCQPCWDQINDLEQHQAALTKAGIDNVVTITSDPIDQIAQKMTDLHLTTPALSDPNLTVIRAYDANQYGMMGDTRAGHSFILVDPNGTIQWRADYGGAPDYTMYLPTTKILADLTKERA